MVQFCCKIAAWILLFLVSRVHEQMTLILHMVTCNDCSGDTGYSNELFSVIGKLYAPFSVAAFPIGSYEPRRLMKHVHMGPREAVRAHNDLRRPTLSVGIHWGTFMMSDEHYLDPPEKLKEAWLESEAERQPVDSDRKSEFITTAFGETVLVENLT